MHEIPHKIKSFLDLGTVLETLVFPQNYPDFNQLNAFQSGYKTDGKTGESTTGDKPTDFKESWYVLCTNYFDDPFFVDLLEEEKGLPVYFAYHGAGGWTPIKVADSLDTFSSLLIDMQQLEGDNTKIALFITKHTDIENEFWKETLLELKENEDDIENNHEVDDRKEWILGKLIITDIGTNKLKLISILKDQFNLSPQEALLMSKQPEIVYKEGYLKQLKPHMDKLHAVGACVEFRENDK